MLNGFPNLFHSFRPVVNFYPRPSEENRKMWCQPSKDVNRQNRKTCHKIAGCLKSRPLIWDISIVDAKFGRILKVFKIQSSKIYVMNDEYHGRKSICDQIYDKYKMYDFV